MYLNLWWPNPFYASEDTKYVLFCVDQTPPILPRAKNISQLVLIDQNPNIKRRDKMNHYMSWAKPSHASVDIKSISTCVEQILSCQRGYKMNLNMCWPNPSHGYEDTKCISTCVDQTHPMPARTQNIFQHVFPTSTMPANTENKSKHELTSQVNEDNKCISTCVDQTPPMQGRTQNISLHVLNKLISCELGHEMYLNLFSTNSFHCQRAITIYQNMLSTNPSFISEDIKCVLNCVDQTNPIQRWHKMHLNMC